jgi:hypothetical protein
MDIIDDFVKFFKLLIPNTERAGRSMRSKNQIFFLIVLLLLPASVRADGDYRLKHLTASELERVKAVKELLSDVDTRSFKDTVHELEKARDPQISLEMKEAMARAYTDIVKEIKVEGQKKKEWLYSMVCLNMAYLQFGGSQGKYGTTTELNRLIRQKLIHYLPQNALKQPGFVYSLE